MLFLIVLVPDLNHTFKNTNLHFVICFPILDFLTFEK